jgi:hypothetical protein
MAGPIDLSSGLVPKEGAIDLSAGLAAPPTSGAGGSWESQPSAYSRLVGGFNQTAFGSANPFDPQTLVQEVKQLQQQHFPSINPLTWNLGPGVQPPDVAMRNTATQGLNEWRSGHPVIGAARMAASAVPVVGPALSAAADTAASGNIAGAVGQVAGTAAPFVLGAAAEKTMGATGNAPHPQAASNLAAAADVGGKPAGVSTVYEDYARPAAQAFRDAAAREGVGEQDFQGRNGYDAAIRVANRLQDDANQQAQPYFNAVQNRPIMPSMRARIQAQIGPIMDGLPPKLQNAIQNANTVGDYNAIRMELNKGGGRFFNAATDTQFAAPESQQAMAQAGNALRNEVYGDIQNVTGTDIRPIKQLEGNAINLRTQFEKAKPVLSRVADQAEAAPGYWQQIRSGKTAVEIGKSALDPLSPIRLLPPDALEMFNTRMQRAVRGGNAASLTYGAPAYPAQPPSFPYQQLPPRTVVTPEPTRLQLPQRASPYNFGQTEIQGTPYPSPPPPPPTSSVQLGGGQLRGAQPAVELQGTRPAMSLREQLQAAARKRR